MWLCLSLAALADEQIIDATDAERLSRALQDIGYQAKLETDAPGDPMIKSRISRSNYFIYFYSCQNHTKCGSVTFKTSYDMKTKPFDLKKINDWNAKKRFGGAYLDVDGDPNLQMSLNMFGGITTKNFEDTMEYWQSSVFDFEKLIGW